MASGLLLRGAGSQWVAMQSPTGKTALTGVSPLCLLLADGSSTPPFRIALRLPGHLRQHPNATPGHSDLSCRLWVSEMVGAVSDGLSLEPFLGTVAHALGRFSGVFLSNLCRRARSSRSSSLLDGMPYLTTHLATFTVHTCKQGKTPVSKCIDHE